MVRVGSIEGPNHVAVFFHKNEWDDNYYEILMGRKQKRTIRQSALPSSWEIVNGVASVENVWYIAFGHLQRVI